MTWHSLTHGTTGLVLGGLTVLALIVTLIQQGTPARMMLASPIVALPCLFVGAVVAAVLAGPLVTGIPAAGADPVRASRCSRSSTSPAACCSPAGIRSPRPTNAAP